MVFTSINSQSELPAHGGDLDRAITQYGGQMTDWLDLSTGISPWPYPPPDVEVTLWQRLPPAPNTLCQAAARYYGCEEHYVVVSPGSQLAIRLLPTLLPKPTTVAIPLIGYQEHGYAWRLAGHQTLHYRGLAELNALIATEQVEHAVVINPNNPTTDYFSTTALADLAQTLRGILLVDEAFADTTTASMVEYLDTNENLMILRSPGKFFGLAGARVGFLLSRNQLADQLKTLLMPWSLSAPACHVVESALRDSNWQSMQKQRIQQAGQKMVQLLSGVVKRRQPDLELRPQALFCSLFGSKESLHVLHQSLAERKIWTRLNTPQEPVSWLRIGLPGPAQSRFEAALDSVIKQ